MKEPEPRQPRGELVDGCAEPFAMIFIAVVLANILIRWGQW